MDLPDADAGDAEWCLREDLVLPSFPQEEILSNAGEQQDGCFVARKRGGLL